MLPTNQSQIPASRDVLLAVGRKFGLLKPKLRCVVYRRETVSPLPALRQGWAASSSNISIFKEFILRARVLKLYRQALRTARRAPGDSRAELRQIIRQEVENNRNNKDKQRIRFLISEGLEKLKRLNEMLDMQGYS